MNAFYFGPLGNLKPVVVSAGVDIQSERGSSEFISSGGVRYVQKSRIAPRTWVLGRSWEDPSWARLLMLAAHGVAPQCWLYDVAVSRENMIPSSLSVGKGSTVDVGGLPMGALPVSHTVSVPILGGRLYAVSAWSETDGPMIAYSLQDGASGVVASYNGSGSASFTAIRDTVLTLTVTRSSVSGLRVNEGSFDGEFCVSSGTPAKVVVEDPARTLQMVTQETKSDYVVTLREVGKPGKI